MNPTLGLAFSGALYPIISRGNDLRNKFWKKVILSCFSKYK